MTTNLEVYGLQEQKTTTGSAPVSQEQESDATVGTGSLKPDRKKKKRSDFSMFATVQIQYFWKSGYLSYSSLQVSSKQNSSDDVSPFCVNCNV